MIVRRETSDSSASRVVVVLPRVYIYIRIDSNRSARIGPSSKCQRMQSYIYDTGCHK